MSESEPTLLDKLKVMNEVKTGSPDAKLPEVGTLALAELQKQAMQIQRADKDAEWAAITTYNQDDIPPLAMAKLYAAMPWGPSGTYLTIPQALMLAIAAHRRRLNPEDGDIFILPSGRIGTSLQGLLKEAKQNGAKLSTPKFETQYRDWPKGLLLTRKDTSVKPWRDVDFSLDAEPGVTCSMTVNGEPVDYTAWLTVWYMPGNPNWYSRYDLMLRVRAMMRALSFGTGIAVSEEIADVDNSSTKGDSPVEPKEPKAPKSVPFAAGQNSK